MRLIDADALMASKKWENCTCPAQVICDAPTIEADLVKCGHWETVPNRDFDGFETVIDGEAEWCSNCKRASKDFKKWFKICPNCGAKMEVEK